MSGIRVIFLDIDGVLNSHIYFEKLIAARKPGDKRVYDEMLDPEAIARLNHLIQETGAKVVISSSWRLAHPLSAIQEMLHKRGFVGEIIGETPGGGGTRGPQIAQWLDEYCFEKVEKFVILDDDDDMEHLMKYLVKTSFYTGLLDSHVSEAMTLLGV